MKISVNKFLIFFALTIIVSVFILSTAVNALANAYAPTVRAWVNGENLYIEIQGGQSSVEMVYVNNSRVSNRNDGSFNVPARPYAGTDEYIRVYAVDLAGNYSNTIFIDNPFYVAAAFVPVMPFVTSRPSPETQGTSHNTTWEATGTPISGANTTTIPQVTSAPILPAGAKPFSIEGTGTVLDNVVEANGKEFFTVITEDGNEFFLVIDRERNTRNVFLLNSVTEDDLMALAKNNNNTGEGAIPVPSPTQSPTPSPESLPALEIETVASIKNNSNTGSLILVLVIVLGVGGAGYYFKILKPQKDDTTVVDDEDSDEDGLEFSLDDEEYNQEEETEIEDK